MSLNLLPSELLAQILDGKFSSIVLNLWKTGDRLLQWKLKNHGIKHLYLDHVEVRGHQWSCKWPQCLKEFRLGSLSFSGRLDGDLRYELMQLHPTLEVLTLSMHGAAVYFAESTKTLPTASSASLSADIAQLGTQPPLDTQSVLETDWNPSKALPSLTSLSLWDSDKTPRKLVSMPTLTHLGLRSPLDCSSLTSLVSLEIRWLDEQCRVVLQNCPKTLTTLKIEAKNWHFKDELALFPRLTTLFTPKGLSGPLPPVLPHFVSNMDLTKDLPNDVDGWLGPDTVNVRAGWPGSKTIFSDFLPRWSNITTLITLDADYHPSYFRYLPRTLKVLHFKGAEDAIFEQAQISGIASIRGPEASEWSKCKQLLLSYQNTNRGLNAAWLNAYIARVENGALCGLPVGLTRLKITCYSLPWTGSHIFILPPLLRWFDVYELPNYGTSTFCRMLPPFLDELILSEESGNYVHSALGERLFMLQFVRNIEIRIDAEKAFITIPLLPRSLFRLYMYITTGTLDVSILALLPSHLSEFSFGCSKPVSQSNWVGLLPRCLTLLNACEQTLPFCASEFPNLPPTLTNLKANVTSLSLRSLYSLPKHLHLVKFWILDDNVGTEEDPPITHDDWIFFEIFYRSFKRVFDKDEADIKRELADYRSKRKY